MAPIAFHLSGESPAKGLEVDLEPLQNIEDLQKVLANAWSVVKPEGLGFNVDNVNVTDLAQLHDAQSSVTVTVDGHSVRQVPGPSGLPLIGSYLEVYPDHLGNNQRLFDKYGDLFRANIMGKTNFFARDPELAQIMFQESDWFSKEITTNHPLFPLKNDAAGVFVSSTSTPSWKVVHKFMPPALGPKAVRHYAPTMNACARESFPIFDQLGERGEAWNGYQYMLKLSSGTIGKVVLGQDMHHFDSIDAPLSRFVLGMAETLALNKKVASRGEWYSWLPFGDAKRLKDVQAIVAEEINKAVKESKSGGTEDLPLQDAALKSTNLIDYFVRAVDGQGKHLPKENLHAAVVVAAGAGFTTTSSLLGWLLYGLVTYPETQARLLQELVDVGFTDDTDVTPDMVEEMPVMDKYIKEMQRRHNPSYNPGRTAQKDMILPGGYRMQKGDVVIPAIHHIHTNPNIWKDPDRFDPDRWDTEEVKSRHKAAYIPFATGQRMCIGFNFALLEVKVFLPHLVWRYHWDKEGESEAEYDPFFQLIRPINLYVKTTRRDVYPSKSWDRQT